MSRRLQHARRNGTGGKHGTMDAIEVVRADLACSRHQAAVVAMMDAYSADPMGDGHPLSDFAKLHLIAGLQKIRIRAGGLRRRLRRRRFTLHGETNLTR